MMKKLFGVCLMLVCLVGCDAIVDVEPEEKSATVDGVVVDVNQDGILISQKSDFNECDFLPVQNDYVESETFYDLLDIANISANVGDVVSVEIEPEIAESYPAQAQGISIKVIAQLDVDKTCGAVVEPPKPPVVEVEAFSQELLDVFPKTLNLQQQFHGYAEYGHIQLLTDIENKESIFSIIFEGQMADGMGQYEGRVFDLVYEVTKDSVIERIENQDPYKRLEDENLLNSIIPQRTILKLPLQVGTTWDESFNFEGKEYVATTTLTKVEVNEAGNTEYVTETIVPSIEGYFEETYKEVRTFEQGRGMINFSNLLSKEAVGVDYPEDEETEDLYIFGYSLTDESVVK